MLCLLGILKTIQYALLMLIFVSQVPGLGLALELHILMEYILMEYLLMEREVNVDAIPSLTLASVGDVISYLAKAFETFVTGDYGCRVVLDVLWVGTFQLKLTPRKHNTASIVCCVVRGFR